jgi:3-hydroxyacyl-[acyl-carrier-protein] dehydratase
MASPEKVNIPQREPMVMVDFVISHTGIETVTGFTVRDDNVFLDNGHFAEPGLIENMAQTAAAGTGVSSSLELKEAPVGFIGGISKLKITMLPAAGCELVTTTTVLHTVANATIVHASVKCDGQPVAECEMKIFLINT